MNGILGVTQILGATRLDPEQKEYLEALKASAGGLLSILGDILDFSKLEAGRMATERVPADLKALCAECVAVFTGAARLASLDLRLDWDPAAPAHVLGDPVRLRQVLMNLLGNAVKFTEKGRVVLAAGPLEGKPGWVRFRVRDTGIGMSQATLETLFEPYTQADASSARRYGGTGLGLAISRRLALLMGGSLEASSALDKGSEFILDLPLEAASAPAPAEPEEKEDRGPEPSLQGKSVLLVEDNAVNRMVATRLLESLGLRVETAVDGRRGIELWEAGSFDVLLMDCQMPGMDGYQATGEIRRREAARGAARRTPIVALTAHALEEDKERCRAAGMDDYLTKPVNGQTLRKLLRSLIR
jgi:CheY-like chemotaxis protein